MTETFPRYSEICTNCKHFDLSTDTGKTRRCDAFPKGIPNEIWLGENDHQKPYPGDHGILHEKKTNQEHIWRLLLHLESFWDEVLTAKDLPHDEFMEFMYGDAVTIDQNLHWLEYYISKGELSEAEVARYHKLKKKIEKRAHLLDELWRL